MARCCTWSSGLFKGLQGGYYWTDHLKTELEVAATGETEVYSYSTLAPGPLPSYVSEHHSYRGVLVSAAQAYQFGRNAFFHPFLGAGFDVLRERDVVERMTSSPGSVTTSAVTQTRLQARPFVMGGFKAYCSERVFFRTDLKAAYRNGFDQITWKLGFGIDF